MTTTHHDTTVWRVTALRIDPEIWRARCKTCGWESREHSSRRGAENDASEHEIHA